MDPSAHVPPMLAVTAESPFDDDNWRFEVKWDGFRAEVSQVETLKIFSRRGGDLLGRFPALRRLAGQLPRPIVLDAELVAWEGGAVSFAALSGRAPRSLVLVAFDCLYSRDGWHLDEPLSRRLIRLRRLVRPGPGVAVADGVVGTGRAFFAAVADKHLEGVMAKRLDSRYRPGRRDTGWQKILAWHTRWVTVPWATRTPQGRWIWWMSEPDAEDGRYLAKSPAPAGWHPPPPHDQGPAYRPREPFWVEVGLRGETERGTFRHVTIRRIRPEGDGP